MQRYREVAVRTAYVVTGLAAEAEDAVQEAMVKAHAALPGFREGAPFKPWLLRIVANEALNRRRAANRRAALGVRASQGRPSGGEAPSPEEAVVADEQRRHLIDALNEMRAEDRLVIAYRYLMELSEAEMVQALGWRKGTVKSRLSRAMGRLRAHLEGLEAIDD